MEFKHNRKQPTTFGGCETFADNRQKDMLAWACWGKVKCRSKECAKGGQFKNNPVCNDDLCVAKG